MISSRASLPHAVVLEEQKCSRLAVVPRSPERKASAHHKVRARWEEHYLGIFLEDGGYDGEV